MKYEIGDSFSLEENSEVEFRKVCGFTFVFLKKILIFDSQITSIEVKPVAIIYEENGEYYLAPLDEVGDIKPIVKKFVEKYL